MTYKVGKCLLREHLKRLGMTQSELALRLNTTKQQVNKYVHGANIMSYETALNISSILGCSMDELYEYKQANE